VSRIAITLDEHALAELTRRASAGKEPVARTAARLVRDGLLSTPSPGTPPTSTPAQGSPRPPARPPQNASSGLPGWLEPTGERERWRRELWASVCTLTERYPRVLSKLAADWWADRAQVEILGALAAWRGELDSGQTVDPRAELLFHDRLDILEHHLTTTGDPTAPRFKGGPPPSDWVA
jgi:hypothetical protein